MVNVIDELHFSTEQEKQEPESKTQHEFFPTEFEQYIGQPELKHKLKIYTQAACQRKEPLDHMLLFGPPGLGKTTLSTIVAQSMNVNIKICSGPTLERTGDLVAILTSLETRDVLFIDEIHRTPTVVEEVLYSAMEQFRVDVIVGQGAGAQSVNLPLNPFTLIGATTKSGMISAPLHSRFGIIERLDFYSQAELAHIIKQSATFLEYPIEKDAAFALAKCSRGTPRIAKKLFRRVRDFAQVNNEVFVTLNTVHHSLQQLGIQQDGLTRLDVLILKKLVVNFNGGPVGLSTIASMIGEDSDTIEQVYEPFLLRNGYLERTARGRKIPAKKLLELRKQFFGQTTI